MHALVIDDSKPVRSILARLLSGLNFEVSEAANGKEGLNCLREAKRPDVVFVNWYMPEMDGLEFVRAVRADVRFNNLPLIAVTSEADPSRVALLKQAGASAYIKKPFTTREIIENLQKFRLAPKTTPLQTPVQPALAQVPRQPIRVLIVDDSVVVRKVVSSVLGEDDEMQVVGMAADGKIALDMLADAQPDLMLLDIEMPNMDGFETLRHLRQSHSQLPVIMFSSLTEKGAAATVEALLLGAKDYVNKPGGTGMADLDAGKQRIREELIPKIKHLTRRAPHVEIARQPRENVSTLPPKKPRPAVGGKADVVAIGVSTGGPNALATLLPAFAPGCPVPVLIVQHMPAAFTGHLARRLTTVTKIDVAEAVDGQRLEPGTVWIAPGDLHMLVQRRGNDIRLGLNQQPPENACRPSADVLFRSIAKTYGSAALAVIMTGMGNDGLQGCQQICAAGGHVLAQDEATSVVWGMPRHVAQAGLADKVLPLDQLGAEIARRVRRFGLES